MDEALIELGFMLVILKLPVVYLCLVVWWAVRSGPVPPEAVVAPRAWPECGPFDRRSSRRPRPGPHGGPVRTYARKAQRRRVTVEP